MQKLTLDQYIYPRQHINKKTVDAYVEAIGIGAKFPPIVVQRVNSYVDTDGVIHEEATLIIDGVHRWSAYIEAEKIAKKEDGAAPVDFEIVHWKDEAIDYRANRAELALASAELNTQHGDRVTDADKKDVARRIAQDDPDQKWTYELLAGKLHASIGSLNGWISDIRARQKSSRDSIIVRLSRLGWTQDEIATAVGVGQPLVNKIINNFNVENIDNLLTEGRDMAYIADLYSMDLALAWTLHLDGQTDQEKFKSLDWGLRTWDLWNFNDCDERFGDDWPGRIPAQLVAHTLYYFTNPGDLVVDPMAGGGVVPDTCLMMGRKCRAFDLATRKERPEIQPHHWQSEGMKWPDIKKADLVFFDPPYFTKMEREYKEKSDGLTPISSLTRDDYLTFFADFFRLALEHTKPGARVAFLNADWRDFQSKAAMEEVKAGTVTVFDYHRLLEDAGWEVSHRVECPMSTQRMNGNTVMHMQAGRILGTVGRTLLIARKS